MRLARVLAALGGLSLLVAGILYFISFMSTPAILLEHQLSPYAATHTATGSLTTVRLGEWVEIPALDIALPVHEGDGSDHIPDWVALHYPGTAEPGEPGNSYLYAHGLWGMFGALLYAKVGEEVILDNYTTHAVQVMHITNVVGRVAYNNTSYIRLMSATPMLTLQTCIGADWDTDRWIVEAA